MSVVTDDIDLNIKDDNDNKVNNNLIHNNIINCFSCKKNEILYNSFPCGCCFYCKKCAMKLAKGANVKYAMSYFLR